MQIYIKYIIKLFLKEEYYIKARIKFSFKIMVLPKFKF